LPASFSAQIIRRSVSCRIDFLHGMVLSRGMEWQI